MLSPARWLACFVVLAWLTGPSTVLAGGGPEGVLLVVNPLSQTSITIANHYVQLRGIPPDNVLYVPWPPNSPTTDVDTFRQRILLPILAHLKKRPPDGTDRLRGVLQRLSVGNHAGQRHPPVCERGAAGSRPSDATRAVTPGGRPGENGGARLEWPKQYTPVGSINGLTYLWEAVGAGFPSYFEPHSNYFALPPVAGQNEPPSRAFRGTREYGPTGGVAFSGRRYYLSTMLGVTTGRGNSLGEGAQLSRAKRQGRRNVAQGNDLLRKEQQRSLNGCEMAFFQRPSPQLTKLGVTAQILEGTVPLNRDNVQGVVMGTPSFDWKASESTIRPGAICDNFTSFGGVLSPGNNQTPLSEFLRYGAAGACGTVTEPFAIAAKFPSPLLQVHYARGCSLAEAFYQSIYKPLPVVGRRRSALPALGSRADGFRYGNRAWGRSVRGVCDAQAGGNGGRRRCDGKF